MLLRRRADKKASPAKPDDNLLEPGENEWRIPKCGRINQSSFGTCGCEIQKPTDAEINYPKKRSKQAKGYQHSVGFQPTRNDTQTGGDEMAPTPYEIWLGAGQQGWSAPDYITKDEYSYC